MRALICLAIMGTTLGGCANGVAGLRPLSYQEPAETRLLVSYRRCPHAVGENLAPVFAAAAMAAVSNLLTSFGTALSKASEGGNLPSSVAASNVEFDRDTIPRCVIVIRGLFEPRGERQGQWTLVDPAQLVTVGNQPQKPLRIRMAGGGYEDKDLPPVYDLQHYVELSLLQSENKSAVSFAPVFTRIARSMDGSRSGSRELAISLQFKRAGADPTEGAVQIGDRQIGKQDTYTVRAETGRYPHESAWFTGVGVPAPTEAEGDARPVDAKSGGDAGGGGGGAVQGGNAPPQPHGAPAGNTATQNTAGDNSTADNKPKKEEAGPYPYTVTATVVETRPTRQFLAFIASVFTATQPAIESEIKGKIDSAQRRANESGDIDTQAAYREALGTAHSAITEYCALGDGDDKRAERWAKSGSASKAQLDANKAALAALVRPLPFSRENLIQVTGGKPTVDNARGCQGHI